MSQRYHERAEMIDRDAVAGHRVPATPRAAKVFGHRDHVVGFVGILSGMIGVPDDSVDCEGKEALPIEAWEGQGTASCAWRKNSGN
jgi:hypothetical protein